MIAIGCRLNRVAFDPQAFFWRHDNVIHGAKHFFHHFASGDTPRAVGLGQLRFAIGYIYDRLIRARELTHQRERLAQSRIKSVIFHWVVFHADNLLLIDSKSSNNCF